MSKPAATILIPLLRQVEAYLERALRSALEQTVPCEVLVVVSPATPAANLAQLDRFRESGRLTVVCRPSGARFARALNIGFEHAHSERVGLLLSDDWLDPRAVETCVEYPGDIVCAGKTIYSEDGERRLDLFRVRTQKGYDQLLTLEARAAYLTHFLLLARAKVREVGGVDETIGDAPGIDDYDLLWTMLEAGASASVVGQSLYNVRDHGGERLTLRPADEQAKNLALIFEKHRVPQAEREKLVRLKRRWFGRTIQEAAADKP
jgi:glycosyltransferase involved in cell wall biosynthesis